MEEVYGVVGLEEPVPEGKYRISDQLTAYTPDYKKDYGEPARDLVVEGPRDRVLRFVRNVVQDECTVEDALNSRLVTSLNGNTGEVHSEALADDEVVPEITEDGHLCLNGSPERTQEFMEEQEEAENMASSCVS